jgi:hypothetical protein
MARQRNTQSTATGAGSAAGSAVGSGAGATGDRLDEVLGGVSATGGAQSGGTQGVADQARDKAQQLAGQAKERVESGVSQGKTRAADTLGSVAQTLRQSTQQLRDQNRAGAGQYIERAADQVQRFSDYLRNTEVDEIVDSVERVARRQPALFLGGAFVLGLAGARFFKSSRRREYQQGTGSADVFGVRRRGRRWQYGWHR